MVFVSITCVPVGPQLGASFNFFPFCSFFFFLTLVTTPELKCFLHYLVFLQASHFTQRSLPTQVIQYL